MAWNGSDTDLRDILATLYSDIGDAKRLALEAQLDRSQINFNDKLVNVWTEIINLARKNGQLLKLIQRARMENLGNEELSALAAIFAQTITYNQRSPEIPRHKIELKRTWSSLHPAVRSAMLMWAFLLVIALLNSFTAGTSLLFSYPIQLMLYVGNGYLAGRFALNDGRHSSELVRIGAVAGFIAWILPPVYYIVLGLMPSGLGNLMGLGALFLCGSIDLAIHATCSAFGAWFVGRNRKEDPEMYDY